MIKLHFPRPFKHDHPPIRNVNEIFEAQLTPGQRAADGVANMMGSWKFIIIQSILLGLWTLLNAAAWFYHWDPYPFILMNLMLSLQAAYAAPIIMMSQNRQAAKDRIDAQNDFQVNKKAEEEVRALLEHNTAQNDALIAIHQSLLRLEEALGVNLNGNPASEKSEE